MPERYKIPMMRMYQPIPTNLRVYGSKHKHDRKVMPVSYRDGYRRVRFFHMKFGQSDNDHR